MKRQVTRIHKLSNVAALLLLLSVVLCWKLDLRLKLGGEVTRLSLRMQSSATLLLRRVASRPLYTLAPRTRIAAQFRPFYVLHGGFERRPRTTVTASWRRASSSVPPQHEKPTADEPAKPTVRENIYTIPNLLTLSRIAACPVLAYSIIQGDFATATAILAYAGTTDWVRAVRNA